MTAAADSPSAKPQMDIGSALPREFRAWRRLRIVKRDESFSLIFSPRKQIYRVGVEVGGAPGGPSWAGCGPPDMDFSFGIFLIFQIDVPWSFRSFRELLFLHINNTMESLLKTASVRVSSIQIMQVRVQNKGKSVWKSRYDGDVSTHSLSHTNARTNTHRHAQTPINLDPHLFPCPHVYLAHSLSNYVYVSPRQHKAPCTCLSLSSTHIDTKNLLSLPQSLTYHACSLSLSRKHAQQGFPRE